MTFTDESVDRLFELAIQAENTARDLYLSLARKFAGYPEVVKFWQQVAADEVFHAQKLQEIRDAAPSEQLAAPADPNVLLQARHVSQFSVEKALAAIHDLEAAINLASDLENSEMNAIFEFLITTFNHDAAAVAFVLSQLRHHLNRFMEFPNQFGDAYHCRAIKVLN